jgi:hypothetical protein
VLLLDSLEQFFGYASRAAVPQLRHFQNWGVQSAPVAFPNRFELAIAAPIGTRPLFKQQLYIFQRLVAIESREGCE